MSFFGRFGFLGFIISVFACACTLEPICKEEDAFECYRSADGKTDHRICHNGQWEELNCRLSEICLENSCVSLKEDCTENATRCLTFRHVEACTVSRKAQIETCEEGFVCNEKSCVQGDDCCVSIKICSETAAQCLNSKTIEVCTESSKAKIETCKAGYICDAEACAQGDDCCVAGVTCGKTYNSCSNEDTLMICVEDAWPIEQACDLGETCDRGQCIEDLCRNHRLDPEEEAVDCGGLCVSCKGCQTDADCGKNGFCDSAFGYVCSKRCRTKADCAKSDRWDGEYCRGDGRCSPKVFETQWELVAADLSIVLPFDPDYPKAKCDYQILWGDEAAEVNIETLPPITNCLSVKKHVYKKAGAYNIKIIGTYDGWGAFDKINTTNSVTLTVAATKLRSVVSFGPVGLSKGAFYGASKLRLMPKRDIPDASKLHNLSSTFNAASSFNDSIDHWDCSQVTSMEKMFFNAEVFNKPIGRWDTSKVGDMNNMFCSAFAFDQAIGDWDTSQVKDMRRMFSQASHFNQAIGAWNTEQVGDMEAMFFKASAFNQPIDNWQTSHVIYMYAMFFEASVFNQPIGAWNVFQVTDMGEMFKSALAFDQSLSKWDLRLDVNLLNIFAASGMNVSHLCALKKTEGEWLKQWAKLGKKAVCE